MTKRGISANGYYIKSGKFGNNSLKLRINSTEDDKGDRLTVGYFCKHFRFGENSEFGKN